MSPGETDKKGEGIDWLKSINLVVTMIIAAGTFLIGQNQQRLQAAFENDSKKRSLVFTYVDKMFDRMKEVGIEDKKHKEAIMFDLLDLMSDADAEMVQDAANKRRRLAVPLQLALVTGNDEFLVHAASRDPKRQVWLDLAKESASPAVRATALLALGHLCESMSSQDQTGALGLLGHIRGLSDNLRNEHTRPGGLAALTTLVGVMASDPDRYRDDSIVRKAYDDVRSANLDIVKQDVEVGNLRAAGGGTADLVKALQAALRAFERLGLKGIEAREVAAAAPTPTSGSPDPQIQQALSQMRSEASEDRHRAREQIAAVGNGAVADLVAELRKDPDDYRVQLGVASSLFRMSQPVSIPPAYAPDVVRLIGADSPMVRKYAAEFLMKCYDPATVAAAHASLSRIIANRDTAANAENLVYNAVVVLGTWLRTLPSESPEREAIRKQLGDLEKKLTPKWAKTTKVIKELRAADQAVTQVRR
jgi:hypothetical protein